MRAVPPRTRKPNRGLTLKSLMIYSCLAWGATASVSHADPNTFERDGSIVLTESQLDLVTAGGAGVDISATSVAVGTSGSAALTSTSTKAWSTGRADRAVGRAVAYACCGFDVAATVAVNYGANGDIVAGVATGVAYQYPLAGITARGNAFAFAYGVY